MATLLAWPTGVRRAGQCLPVTDLIPPTEKEEVKEMVVRVRTIGDIIRLIAI